MGQRKLERLMERRGDKDEVEEPERDEEEGGYGIAEGLNSLNKEIGGTEEEEAEGLEAALGMASQEMEVEEDREEGRERTREGRL